MKMNLPNKLTIFRIILVPLFMAVMLSGIKNSMYIAAVIFAVASLTDFLDGYIARKYDLVSNFGKFMDPLADKLLVSAALITLVQIQVISSWAVVIIIAREFSISILRAIAGSSGIVIAASQWGKAKTVSQIIAIMMLLLSLPGAQIMLWVAVALTIYSGYDYVKLNKEMFAQS